VTREKVGPCYPPWSKGAMPLSSEPWLIRAVSGVGTYPVTFKQLRAAE
jgi:hypothetical protein